MNLLRLTMLTLFLSGCSLEGSVSEQDLGKDVVCTVFATQEKFTYNASDVNDVRIGMLGAPTTFVVADSEGVMRRVSSHEVFCVTDKDEGETG